MSPPLCGSGADTDILFISGDIHKWAIQRRERALDPIDCCSAKDPHDHHLWMDLGNRNYDEIGFREFYKLSISLIKNQFLEANIVKLVEYITLKYFERIEIQKRGLEVLAHNLSLANRTRTLA